MALLHATTTLRLLLGHIAFASAFAIALIERSHVCALRRALAFLLAAVMLPANVSVTRRSAGPVVLFAVLILSTIYYRALIFGSGRGRVTVPVSTHDGHKEPAAFNWARVKPRYPVTSYIPLPSPPARALPKLQHTPSKQTGEPARIRQERLQAVKAEFVHAWDGYR